VNHRGHPTGRWKGYPWRRFVVGALLPQRKDHDALVVSVPQDYPNLTNEDLVLNPQTKPYRNHRLGIYRLVSGLI
jgi:hypothetical protein